jgi:hypothetical protein
MPAHAATLPPLPTPCNETLPHHCQPLVDADRGHQIPADVAGPLWPPSGLGVGQQLLTLHLLPCCAARPPRLTCGVTALMYPSSCLKFWPSPGRWCQQPSTCPQVPRVSHSQANYCIASPLLLLVSHATSIALSSFLKHIMHMVPDRSNSILGISSS